MSDPNIYVLESRRFTVGRNILSLKAGMSHSCNSLLASIENYFPVIGVLVDFSKEEKSSQLNGIFFIDGVCGSWRRKITSVLIWSLLSFVSMCTKVLYMLRTPS